MGDVTKISTANAWNITRIGEAFGMSRDTVRKRLKAYGAEPVLVNRGAGHYALNDVGPALFATATSKGTCAGYESPDEMPADVRKDWFDSELKRLKVGKEESSLVPDDEVAREMSELIKAVVNPLDGITDTLERKAELSAQQAAVVQAEIDAIREQMYIAASGLELESSEG